MKLSVNLKERSYNIKIEKGLFKNIAKEVGDVFKGEKIFIITDDNVEKYYGNEILSALRNEGFNTEILIFPHGESIKSLKNCEFAYEKLSEFHLSRSDLIIALGGGVIGDFAGFIAASYLRGVNLIQVPTSLLAQVDSSIGGKVAVNLTQGKNLVGFFYQPKAVFIDTETLNTLPDKFFSDGMGEVLKYAFIRDEPMYETLLKFKNRENLMKNIGEIIYRCCKIKGEIVEKDERDTGERLLLNFGHTLGHAIEAYTKYKEYSHGEAVSIGMVEITKLFEKKGICEKNLSEKMEAVLKSFQLPTVLRDEYRKNISDFIKNDKKFLNGKLNLVAVTKIGESKIIKSSSDFFQNL